MSPSSSPPVQRVGRNAAFWSIASYVVLLVAGMFASWISLLWPGSMMLVLQRFHAAAQPLSLALGAVGAVTAGAMVDRRRKSEMGAAQAAGLGTAAMLLSLVVLVFLGWNLATWNHWPIGD